jgi:hypothetical protein
VKNLHSLLVVHFYPRCDETEDYMLTVWSKTATLSHEVRNGNERPVADFRRPSRRTVGAITYTFRFSSRRFGGATAFRFYAATGSLSDPTSVSDRVPWLYKDYLYYDLLSR